MEINTNAILLTIASVFVLAASSALAHEHSVNVCSSVRQNICAHLGFEKPLNSKSEGEFMAHVTIPRNPEIQNFKLDLWMDMGGGHGHGSAPVDIKDLGANRFEISNAWFVMPGTWLVRMDFDFEGSHYRLEIPVLIKD